MIKTVSKLMIVSLTMGSMFSCSKLDETSKNAKKATINSGRAADAASESREEIANGRMMTRSGNSSASRRDALDSLMKMETLAMKITEASKFVKAFEFQLWTGQRYDSQEYLDQLYEDATEEFFRSLYEANGDKSVAKSNLSPFKLFGKAKNESLNVYAISLAMHGVHNVQEKITKPREKNITDTTSMYDLIKRGLTKAKMVEEGKLSLGQLKDFEQTVYDYREDAIALTEVRYNAMMTLSAARLSPIKESKLEALKTLYIKRSYPSKFNSLNIGQQYQLNVYLDAAIKVKKFMEDQLSITPMLINPIAKLYQKMQLGDDIDSDKGSVGALALKRKERSKYLNHLSQIFKIENNRLQVK